MVQERLGPYYFFISLVLGPLNSLLWYVPSSRYIWSSAPIFCFLQEQIKDIIIISPFSSALPAVGQCLLIICICLHAQCIYLTLRGTLASPGGANPENKGKLI